MTNEELFVAIYDICRNPNRDVSSFKCSAKEVALFAMGTCVIDPYADFTEHQSPWSQVLQVGRIMKHFDSAPGNLSIALACATFKKHSLDAYQKANLIDGFGRVMSDYSYRVFKRWAKEGIEDSTTRTVNIVSNILALGKLLAILETPNTSVNLESVQYQIGYANMALFPMCNNDVDANPVSKDILQMFIDAIHQRVTYAKKDVA